MWECNLLLVQTETFQKCTRWQKMLSELSTYHINILSPSILENHWTKPIPLSIKESTSLNNKCSVQNEIISTMIWWSKVIVKYLAPQNVQMFKMFKAFCIWKMAFNKRKEISWHENCLLWVTLSLIQQDKAWYQFVKIITNNLLFASIIPPTLVPKCSCEYIFMLNICSSTIHRTTYFTTYFFKSLEIGHLKAVNKLLKHWQ